MYRIDKTPGLRILFIIFAAGNSIYCCESTNPFQAIISRLIHAAIWDLAMDWSLCNPYAEHFFLRNVLAFKHVWIYYVAMVLDPILRFNWIFYAIYGDDVQHSTLASFFVGFSEVLRRGMWTAFRMENEHSTNVGRFRASRDIPLPYEITSSPDSSEDIEDTAPPADQTDGSPSKSTTKPKKSPVMPDLERQGTPGSLRRRHPPHTGPGTPLIRAFTFVGNAMTTAHAQDFERKRRSTEMSSGKSVKYAHSAHEEDASSDEDSEEEDAHDVEDVMEAIRRRDTGGSMD
jgi:xenotropic and polytropic retrovirus receptor 1